MPTETLPTFVLVAEKRAIRAPEGKLPARKGFLVDWVKDEEGFQRRWPNNLRPEGDKERSKRYKELADKAYAFNEAQLRSNFLDWLWSVDLDAPQHRSVDGCCTEREDE